MRISVMNKLFSWKHDALWAETVLERALLWLPNSWSLYDHPNRYALIQSLLYTYATVTYCEEEQFETCLRNLFIPLCDYTCFYAKVIAYLQSNNIEKTKKTIREIETRSLYVPFNSLKQDETERQYLIYADREKHLLLSLLLPIAKKHNQRIAKELTDHIARLTKRQEEENLCLRDEVLKEEMNEQFYLLRSLVFLLDLITDKVVKGVEQNETVR